MGVHNRDGGIGNTSEPPRRRRCGKCAALAAWGFRSASVATHTPVCPQRVPSSMAARGFAPAGLCRQLGGAFRWSSAQCWVYPDWAQRSLRVEREESALCALVWCGGRWTKRQLRDSETVETTAWTGFKAVCVAVRPLSFPSCLVPRVDAVFFSSRLGALPGPWGLVAFGWRCAETTSRERGGRERGEECIGH